MRPQRYMDLEILSQDAGAGIPAPVIASGVLQVLHGFFANYKGEYALALPGWGDGLPESRGYPWRALRVFVQDMEALDRLMAGVADHHLIRDYTRPGFPRPVPHGFEGKWVEYRRYRISSRKAGVDNLRHRRLIAAVEKDLPYFKIRSTTNEQPFILAVEPRPAPPSVVDAEVVPDSYGLSVQSRAFALPHIPLT